MFLLYETSRRMENRYAVRIAGWDAVGEDRRRVPILYEAILDRVGLSQPSRSNDKPSEYSLASQSEKEGERE